MNIIQLYRKCRPVKDDSEFNSEVYLHRSNGAPSGEKVSVRRQTRITPCKAIAAARGKKRPRTPNELRRSSTSFCSTPTELCFQGITFTPSCATLARGYQHSTPSEFYTTTIKNIYR